MLADETIQPTRRPKNSSLPTELLLKIIPSSRGLPFMFNCDPIPSVNDVALPFALAGVCRHWRDVAVDIPWLWNGMHIEGNRASVERTLNTQLEATNRAQHLPLFLTLVLRDADFLETCRLDDTLLCGIESKVMGLDLFVPYDAERHERLDQNAAEWMKRFTNLERLYLGEDFAFRDCPDAAMWTQLTHLHVQKSHHEDWKDMLDLTLPRLTSLTYEINYHLDLDLPTFFRSFPNLVELFICADEIIVDSDVIATHPKLERFGLCDVLAFDHDPRFSFFTHALLPSLKDLAIHGSSLKDLRKVVPLLETLKRFNVRLDRFTIMSGDFRREWKVFEGMGFFQKVNAANGPGELSEIKCFDEENEENIFKVLETLKSFKTLMKKRVFGVLKKLGLAHMLQETGDFSKLIEVGAYGEKKAVNELKELKEVLDGMMVVSEIVRELKGNFEIGYMDYANDLEEAAIFRESKA
ncbi:hypothetical protein CONPUDRAFT_163655, partial [Coniophora puteana RWD-64-598 SS2]